MSLGTNLTAIGTATTTVGALANTILASPYDDSRITAQLTGSTTQSGPTTFIFNYYGDQDVTLDSDITDHYVQDNTALQDQIALKPILIRGEGFVGELNDVGISASPVLAALQQSLVAISAYTPQLSVTALLAFNQAQQAYQIAQVAKNTIVSAAAAIGGSSTTPQNKQQQAYNFFVGYRASRTLFKVWTPWGIFQNCAIKTLRAIQDKETKMISSFDVTFKVINFASTSLLAASLNAQGQLVNQAQAGQSPIDGGTYSPSAGPSLSDSLGSNSFFGLSP